MGENIAKQPLVSIILPVYNAAEYISESINSILGQSYYNFELLILNDGSTDESEKVILSYKDSRLRYIRSDKNKGLVYQLNKGIELSKGKYIARMDADDVSLPTRLEMQVHFMEENPEIGVLGTAIQIFGDSNKIKYYPQKHDECVYELLYRSCFAHPSVMIRKEVLLDHNISFSSEYFTVEDYVLWIELAKLTKFYNLKEILLNYRISNTSISVHKKDKQLKLKQKVQLLALKNILDIEFNKNEEDQYLLLINPFQKANVDWGLCTDLITKISVLSNKKELISEKLIVLLKQNSISLALYNTENGLVSSLKFFSFKRKHKVNMSLKDQGRLILKSIFKIELRTA